MQIKIIMIFYHEAFYYRNSPSISQCGLDKKSVEDIGITSSSVERELGNPSAANEENGEETR